MSAVKANIVKSPFDKQIKKCIELMKNEEISDYVMRWAVERNMHKSHKTCGGHLTNTCVGTARKEEFKGNGKLCNECYNFQRRQTRKEAKEKEKA